MCNYSFSLFYHLQSVSVALYGRQWLCCLCKCLLSLSMCGCKCVIEGKGVVNSWHHGLSLSLSLCPRRTWQRVLKLEDRHDITHSLIYTISSIFNWRIWFAERQTWVNERERKTRSSLFIGRSYLGDYPSSLSLISVRERHETERKEREREREREKLDTLIPGFPLNMNSLSFCHYQTFSLSFYHYQHIPDEHVYIEKRLLRYTERHEEEREGEREMR